MKIITLQPSSVTDHITEDGTELQQLPYPFHVREDGKLAGGPEDFWASQIRLVAGFQDDLARQRVDLYWDDLIKSDPERAVGKYLVTHSPEGGMAVWPVAISSVAVTEVRDDLYVVVAPHYWGKGATLEAAKRECRHQGGRLSEGYVIFRFDYRSDFQGVNDLGTVSWLGDRPEITEKAPRRKSAK